MNAFIAGTRPPQGNQPVRQGTDFFARSFSTIDEFVAYATESHRKLKNALAVPGNQVTFDEKLEYAFLALFLSHWSKSESFPDLFEKLQTEIHAHVKKNPAMHGMFYQVLTLIHSRFVATNTMKPSLAIKAPVPQSIPPAAWTGQNVNVQRSSVTGRVGGLRSYASPLIPVNMPAMNFFFTCGAAPEEFRRATDADAVSRTKKTALDENTTPICGLPQTGLRPSSKHEFSVGELVEYYSRTAKRYVKSVVKRLLPCGNYELDCKQYALASHIRLYKPEQASLTGIDTDITQLVLQQNRRTSESDAFFATSWCGVPTEGAARLRGLSGAGQSTAENDSLASNGGNLSALISMPTIPLQWRAESETTTGASHTSVNTSARNSVNSSAQNSASSLAHTSLAHASVNISVHSTVTHCSGRNSVNNNSGYIPLRDDSVRSSVTDSASASCTQRIPDESRSVRECSLTRTVVIQPPSPRTEKNNNIVRNHDAVPDGAATLPAADDVYGSGHTTVPHENAGSPAVRDRDEALCRRTDTLWMRRFTEQDPHEDSTQKNALHERVAAREGVQADAVDVDNDRNDGALNKTVALPGRNTAGRSRRAGPSGSRRRASSAEQCGSEWSVDDDDQAESPKAGTRQRRARRVSFHDEIPHRPTPAPDTASKTNRESSIESVPSPLSRVRQRPFVSRNAQLLRELDEA